MLGKTSMERITLIRRVTTLLAELICVLLLILIYYASDDNVVEFLAVNPCSDDETINKTFVDIAAFFEGATFRLWLNMVVVIFIFVVDCASFAEKYNYEKK